MEPGFQYAEGLVVEIVILILGIAGIVVTAGVVLTALIEISREKSK